MAMSMVSYYSINVGKLDETHKWYVHSNGVDEAF